MSLQNYPCIAGELCTQTTMMCFMWHKRAHRAALAGGHSSPLLMSAPPPSPPPYNLVNILMCECMEQENNNIV